MKEKDIKKLIQQEVKEQLFDISSMQHRDVVILLKNYNKYTHQLKYLQEALKEVEDTGVLPTSSNNLTDKVQSSMVFLEPIIKLENKKDILKEKIILLQGILEHIEVCMNVVQINDRYNLLEMRYINKMSVEEILNKANISYRSYTRHHSNLIKEIKSLLII